MREIKFRGKKLCQDEWIYGSLITRGEKGAEGNFIDTGKGECYPLQQDTIGQFTGLRDCKGKEIYEGDIIRSSRGNMHYIEYDEDRACFAAVKSGKGEDKVMCSLSKYWIEHYEKEVIGNVIDNSDVLKFLLK